MNAFRVAVLLFVSALAASFAGETNTLPTTITVDGITYSNVIWRAFTPVAASISHRTGAATIPLWKLTPDLQTHFGYDPQKAALYAEAQRNAEVARQEALRKQRADEAEGQRQVAAITATNQAIEAAAKKAAQENEIHYGPITQLRFSYGNRLQQLANGNYSANLWYSDSQSGEWKAIYVELPPAGRNYFNSWMGIAGGNGWSVYGRPYTANLQNGYGAQYTETAYWLVGVNSVGMNGVVSW
jgi:hypothetical protein